MTVYQAIEKMREMSRDKIPFSFSFTSYNRTQQKSSGIVDVANAKLLGKKPTEDPAEDAVIEYFDYDKGEPRRFFLPSLMTFEGRRVNLV